MHSFQRDKIQVLILEIKKKSGGKKKVFELKKKLLKIKPWELQKSILMLATESNKIPQKVKDEMKKNLLN